MSLTLKIIRYATTSVVVILALSLINDLLNFYFIRSPIYYTAHAIDLQSGRICVTHFIFWTKIHELIQDSAITKALRPDDYVSSIPIWRTTHTFSIGRGQYSPYIRWAEAPTQVTRLGLAWDLGNFKPAARNASAIRVLQLWRESKTPSEANRYVRSTFALIQPDERTIDVKDLPTE